MELSSTSKALIRIALERRYLEPSVARQVVEEAMRRKTSPERILLERRLLSVRRLDRLRNHLRYRTTRKSDKRYAELAVELGLLTPEEVEAGLRHQKQVFRRTRECVRLGAHLIEEGLLSLDADRGLRDRLKGRPVQRVEESEREASSAATLPLHEESVGGSQSRTSYRAIEAALERVEAIRAIQQELSTSDNARPEQVRLDSAAEFENACRMLARRRVEGDVAEDRPRRRRRTSKKSTAKFLAALFNKGAA